MDLEINTNNVNEYEYMQIFHKYLNNFSSMNIFEKAVSYKCISLKTDIPHKYFIYHLLSCCRLYR